MHVERNFLTSQIYTQAINTHPRIHSKFNCSFNRAHNICHRTNIRTKGDDNFREMFTYMHNHMCMFMYNRRMFLFGCVIVCVTYSRKNLQRIYLDFCINSGRLLLYDSTELECLCLCLCVRSVRVWEIKLYYSLY